MRLYPPVWVIPRDAINDDRDRRLSHSCRIDDPAQPLPHAPASRLLGESRGVRPRSLSAGAVAGSPAPRLLSVRRRAAPVHGRRHGDDGDAADHGDGRAAIPDSPGARAIARRSSASSTCCRATACGRRFTAGIPPPRRRERSLQSCHRRSAPRWAAERKASSRLPLVSTRGPIVRSGLGLPRRRLTWLAVSGHATIGPRALPITHSPADSTRQRGTRFKLDRSAVKSLRQCLPRHWIRQTVANLNHDSDRSKPTRRRTHRCSAFSGRTN